MESRFSLSLSIKRSTAHVNNLNLCLSVFRGYLILGGGRGLWGLYGVLPGAGARREMGGLMIIRATTALWSVPGIQVWSVKISESTYVLFEVITRSMMFPVSFDHQALHVQSINRLRSGTNCHKSVPSMSEINLIRHRLAKALSCALSNAAIVAFKSPKSDHEEFV